MLVENRDYKPLEVRAHRERAQRGHRVVVTPTFYLVSRLDELAAIDAEKKRLLKDARSAPIPADDRLPKVQAMQEFGWDHATINTLIENEKIRHLDTSAQVISSDGRTGLHDFIFVSRSDCIREHDKRRRRQGPLRYLKDGKRGPKIPKGIFTAIKRMGYTLAEIRANMPADGIPVLSDASKTHGLEWHGIINQCSWDPHPLLGKRIAVGLGEYTVNRQDQICRTQRIYVSKKDIATIADLIENPTNKTIPGNRGVWMAPGIYREDSKLWFTVAYIKDQYGLSSYISKICASQEVVWPSRTMQRGGKVTVYADTDVQRFLARKERKETLAGEWLAKWLIWRGPDGSLWYTQQWIAQQLGVNYALDLNGYKYEELRNQWPPTKAERQYPLRSVFVFAEPFAYYVLGRPAPAIVTPVKSQTPPNQHTKETPNKTPKAASQTGLPKVDQAIVIIIREPGLSTREVARRVGCSASTLSENPGFQRAQSQARNQNAGYVPRGYKTKEGNIEAQDDRQDDGEK